ncbi:hypothetical protein [Herbaspirillum sp. CF444]|uniref:hypothetical protein n=1 Tax=Herbaspirillum sp. CF444 TaxID=1144319 RepID=UPI0012F8EC27|nr:hypothetical protein [Herbaspirillum sp. CF444]
MMSPHFLFIKMRSKYACGSGSRLHCRFHSGTGNQATLTVLGMNAVFQIWPGKGTASIEPVEGVHIENSNILISLLLSFRHYQSIAEFRNFLFGVCELPQRCSQMML